MKIANNAVSVMFILCVVALAALAQQKNSPIAKADILFSKGKPTIYLTFEDAGKFRLKSAKIAADGSNQETQGTAKAEDAVPIVRLRLHNNTCWAIGFPTDSLYVGPKMTPLRLSDGRGVLGLREGIEVNARYEVEAAAGEKLVKSPGHRLSIIPVKAKPPVIRRSDMFSISWLPPGRSVIFVVPREHLAENLRVYVPYNYEWETSESDFGSGEPEHRVYFHASDLPNELTKSNHERLRRSSGP
jgi:hypothetical protein